MRGPVTCQFQRRVVAAEPGFTLLEVLVVVLLIGIMSGIAILGLGAGSGERRLREEAMRMAALMAEASSEAVMQNREFGLRITADGYEFLCLDEAAQRWRACTDDASWRAHELPAGMSVDVLRDSTLVLPLAENDKPAAVRDDSKSGDREPRFYPDILFLSSGEASPASLELRLESEPSIREEIRVDELGRVQRVDEDGRALEAAPLTDDGDPTHASS